MKIGLLYEDINTNELFICDNFTRYSYIWVNVNGNRIEETKDDAWKHVKHTACKDKGKIREFMKNLNYNVSGFCSECGKVYSSKFVKYENERAVGELINCPICGHKLF